MRGRLRDGIWRKSGTSKELQIDYLFSWPKWPLGCYGMSAGVGGWAKAMCGRREVRRERSCDPLEMGTGWEDCHSWRSAAEMLRRLRDWTWRR